MGFGRYLKQLITPEPESDPVVAPVSNDHSADATPVVPAISDETGIEVIDLGDSDQNPNAAE